MNYTSMIIASANSDTQGIHMLLNYCPKLTHLSLTGVQAFLREELLAFCREAPPEFNEHQRDVFCVFSGTGVARLRDFLNDQKRREDAAGSVAGSSNMEDSDMVDVEDLDNQSPASDGSSTPVLTVDVSAGNYPPGATAGPSNAIPFPPVPPMHHHPQVQIPSAASILSQSAPATTGAAVWSGSNTPVGHGGVILDEDEEGDETFGEGSDTMGD